MNLLAELQPAARSTSLAVAARQLGAKRELARELGRPETPGVDLVHRAVNDLLALRAFPRTASLHLMAPAESGFVESVVAGVVRACRGHDVALAGACVSAANEGEHVSISLAGEVVAGAPPPAAGGVIVGLRASAPTDEDLPWIQARLADLQLGLGDRLPSGDTVAQSLLATQKSHFSVLRQPLLEGWCAALAPVGEGGLAQAVRSLLPAGCDAVLEAGSWQPPALLERLLAGRPVAASAPACSCGLGMLALAPAAAAKDLLAHIGAWNEPAWQIGELVPGRGDVRFAGG
jgi:phosphoribosylformylglycinamidine cyclo-ligase